MDLLIVVIGLVIDRVTKLWALKSLSKIKEISVIDNFCSLYYLENKGAAFGILQNKTTLLTIISLAVLIGIVYYIIVKKPSSKLLKIGLCLIISGAIGNLLDRLIYKYVIDFILLHYRDLYYFPVFNVADIMVTTGTILLIIYLLREGKYEQL